MTTNSSSTESHSLTSRPMREPSTPEMNGGYHHSRFPLKHKDQAIANENRSPSTPVSPSGSSSGKNSTTVAERRQTKSSKYLVTDDFKSDFAIKLSQLRQREKSMESSSEVITASISADHDQAIDEDEESQDSDTHTTTDTTHTNETTNGNTSDPTTDIINTTGNTNPSQPPQFATPGQLRARVDGDYMHEPEPNGCVSSTLNQKEPPSFRSPSLRSGEEDPDEQSARYEVISKLADQLAEQIEENDSMLYELGVVRSNNARLQAVAADKEDELACLTQHNRQLESIITRFNEYSPAVNSKDQSQAQALISQLHHVRTELCQLLALGSTRHPDQFDLKCAAHVRHMRRYSESDVLVKCLQDHHTSRQLVPTKTNEQGSRQFSARSPSDQTLLGQDIISGRAGFVDQTETQSLKAQIHWLQAELTNSRSARLSTEAVLQSLIETITQNTQSLNMNASDTRFQGLGLLSRNTPGSVFSTPDANCNETMNHKASPTSVTSINPEEHHNTRSPLLALANFGFSGWGRKPDSISPSKQTADDTSRIPSSMTVSDRSPIGPSPLSGEKEATYTFKHFALRSLFNHSTGTPPAKTDVTLIPSPLPASLSPIDASRKLSDRSRPVVDVIQTDPVVQDNHLNTHLKDIINPQNADPLIFKPQLPSLESLEDRHLLLKGRVLPKNPNAITV
ncbi:hypothetical protein KEM48_009804 [Puccinia striiformis f. sp. tritici PST-130]|nr:hypothetical protein Pst134EB_026138 [Puccinia striiformis f. sp. tritici]KAI9627505.1 hypothetical protein KEM48_009804 [Puccinia striiformis f. sp. tritici PST-130]